MVKRFEIWLVDLNPTKGHEINKVRPCVVISPDPVNDNLKTVIIVSLTSTIRDYPTRVDCTFQGKKGQLMTDQLRSVDQGRLIKKLGKLDLDTSKRLMSTLQLLFKY